MGGVTGFRNWKPEAIESSVPVGLMVTRETKSLSRCVCWFPPRMHAVCMDGSALALVSSPALLQFVFASFHDFPTCTKRSSEIDVREESPWSAAATCAAASRPTSTNPAIPPNVAPNVGWRSLICRLAFGGRLRSRLFSSLPCAFLRSVTGGTRPSSMLRRAAPGRSLFFLRRVRIGLTPIEMGGQPYVGLIESARATGLRRDEDKWQKVKVQL